MLGKGRGKRQQRVCFLTLAVVGREKWAEKEKLVKGGKALE